MSQARLPEPVATGVSELIEAASGKWPTIEAVTPVIGGCINHAARIDFDHSDSLFLKWNTNCPADFFEKEARGLSDLAAASRLRVPEVVGLSSEYAGGPPWIALEFVARGLAAPDFDARLGEGLAELHAHRARDTFGWATDNYIGTIRQANGPLEHWAAFWTVRRLGPGLERARRHLSTTDVDDLRRLFDQTDEGLAVGQEEGPALLHGDLWSGNVYPDPDGKPVLVDPAIYAGHREVDLAMTELFGGFGEAFYEAYESATPMLPGYRSQRRDIYQLYPLLVHVSLFGATYVPRFRVCLGRALGRS